jgi:chemotaxis protein MotC
LLAGLPVPVLAAADAPAAAPPAAIEPLPVDPLSGLAKTMRALHLVQDRLAAGNGVALDAQSALLERIMIAGETGLDLADAHERAVVALALMNGADPSRFAGLRAAAPEDALLAGALAFAEGRQPAAAAALARVDAAALAPAARAQMRLIEGVIQAESAPEVALAKFAEARLIAPGTLIEEAALRREVLLHVADPARMATLASSYVRRFGASPFASAFITRLASAVADAPGPVQETLSAELDRLLAPARATDRQAFFAILARSTLVSGNHVLAKTAAARALSEAADDSMVLSARLYRAALAIASDAHEEAARELHSLQRAPLSADDREILAAAISVARELRRWPFDDTPAPATSARSTGLPPGIGPDDAAAPAPTAAMQAARAALTSSDTLVSRP